MSRIELLLFGRERWALAPHWVAQVESASLAPNSDTHELAEWGIDNTSECGAPHLLRMRGMGKDLSLLVYGVLTPHVFEDDHILPLPFGLFSRSPVSAVVKLAEPEGAALLIDPARFFEQLA